MTAPFMTTNTSGFDSPRAAVMSCARRSSAASITLESARHSASSYMRQISSRFMRRPCVVGGLEPILPLLAGGLGWMRDNERLGRDAKYQYHLGIHPCFHGNALAAVFTCPLSISDALDPRRHC